MAQVVVAAQARIALPRDVTGDAAATLVQDVTGTEKACSTLADCSRRPAQVSGRVELGSWAQHHATADSSNLAGTARILPNGDSHPQLGRGLLDTTETNRQEGTRRHG